MSELVIRMKALETRAQDLLAEIKSMRNRIGQLETENEKLRQHLAFVYDVRQEGETAPEDAAPLTGRRNLESLYVQGFHICNIHFGQARNSECLFCAAFLRRDRE